VIEDPRPQETPEGKWDDLRAAIKDLAEWMLDEGFDAQETRDWLRDVIHDAYAEAVREAIKESGVDD